MDVLTRNYFQMLRNGAFGENGLLEPMSKFKWNALYQKAECDEVSMYLKEDAPNVSINFEDHKQGRKFRNIAKTEYHAIDTSLDTLDMLNIMLYNIDQTLSGHTSLHGIIEMGRFLRKKGDKVDFLKLEGWFRKLGVNNMAQLHGSILISLFGFQLDELPFMDREKAMAETLGERDRRLTLAYLTHYPLSTTHSMLRRLHHSITQIEE